MNLENLNTEVGVDPYEPYPKKPENPKPKLEIGAQVAEILDRLEV